MIFFSFMNQAYMIIPQFLPENHVLYEAQEAEDPPWRPAVPHHQGRAPQSPQESQTVAHRQESGEQVKARQLWLVSTGKR